MKDKYDLDDKILGLSTNENSYAEKFDYGWSLYLSLIAVSGLYSIFVYLLRNEFKVNSYFVMNISMFFTGFVWAFLRKRVTEGEMIVFCYISFVNWNIVLTKILNGNYALIWACIQCILGLFIGIKIGEIIKKRETREKLLKSGIFVTTALVYFNYLWFDVVRTIKVNVINGFLLCQLSFVVLGFLIFSILKKYKVSILILLFLLSPRMMSYQIPELLRLNKLVFIGFFSTVISFLIGILLRFFFLKIIKLKNNRGRL